MNTSSCIPGFDELIRVACSSSARTEAQGLDGLIFVQRPAARTREDTKKKHVCDTGGSLATWLANLVNISQIKRGVLHFSQHYEKHPNNEYNLPNMYPT